MTNNANRALPLLLLGACVTTTACKAEQTRSAQPVRTAAVETSVQPEPADYQEIDVKGAKLKNGAFDISLEYGPDGTGWMAYSRVKIPKFVETHLARSDDNGRSWNYVNRITDSDEGTFEADGKSVEGAWRDETPSLIYDPTDTKKRRWKLFTNHYFTTKPFKPKNRLMHAGTIDLRYAASPQGPWSEPRCAVGYRPDCGIHLPQAHPDLSHLRMITEPSALVVDEVLYLAMDASSPTHGLGEWHNYRIVLLASEDHGKNWRYVGQLLGAKDAEKFGYLVFTGASLVKLDQRVFLFATPSGSKQGKNKGHDGLMVMEVTDISKAAVARDSSGRPRVFHRLVPDRGSGGLADYDAMNTAGGIVLSRNHLFSFPRVFRLLQTGKRFTPP